ncbi:MAG: hypothetical protein KF858_14095 [Candidatus Sumerlaeia bacterium]|nr:hypothetical protein [Candidatus Sumerlaeia bacterium]
MRLATEPGKQLERVATLHTGGFIEMADNEATLLVDALEGLETLVGVSGSEA